MNKKQREEVILMERKDPVSKCQVLLTLIRSIIKAEKHYKFTLSLCLLCLLCLFHLFLIPPFLVILLVQEISTVEDEVVEFTDDKNQLVWFLQPNEAQFFLAAETLKFKPKPFGKAKTPFTPIHGHSPQITPSSSNPSLHLYTVKPDSDTSRSAESSESEDHVHNCVAREAWGPGEIIGSYSGGKKKRNCFCKLKRVLQKIGKQYCNCYQSEIDHLVSMLLLVISQKDNWAINLFINLFIIRVASTRLMLI